MHGFILLSSGSWKQHRVWLGVIFFFQQTSAGRSSNGKWGVAITHTHTYREGRIFTPQSGVGMQAIAIFLVSVGISFSRHMGSLGFNTGWERYDTIYGDGGNIGMGWDGMGWGRIRSSGHTRAMYRSKHHKSSLMVWPEHIYLYIYIYIYIIYYFTQCVSMCLHL